jgi:hypothetical protein
MDKPAPRFSGIETFMLMGFAGVCDIFSIIPGVNDFVGLIFWVVMGGIFAVKGVSFTKQKGIIGNSLVSMVISFVPILSILPECLVSTALNIHAVNKHAKRQDAEDAKNLDESSTSRITRILPHETRDQYAQRMNRSGSQVQANSLINPSGQPVRTSKVIQFAKSVPTSLMGALSNGGGPAGGAAGGAVAGKVVANKMGSQAGSRLTNMLLNSKIAAKAVTPKATPSPVERNKIENRLPPREVPEEKNEPAKMYVTEKPSGIMRPGAGLTASGTRSVNSFPTKIVDGKLVVNNIQAAPAKSPLADGAKVSTPRM